MDEAQKKSFDIATEVSKQLISLATGITALTVTFATDVFPDSAKWLRYLLAAAWVAYLLSAMCGVGALMCLAGGLERPADEKERFSIYKTNIQRAQKGQVFLFGLATFLVVVFGIIGVVSDTGSGTEESGSSMKLELEKGASGRGFFQAETKQRDDD